MAASSSTQSQSATTSNASQANKSKDPDDPVTKLKSSIPLLKDAISNLFKQASNITQLQSGEPVDTADGKLTFEQQIIKFAKTLEEFHHTCDALETSITVARATYIQASESNNFTSKPDGTDSDISPQVYSDYLSHVRSQVTATKEIHDMLLDFSRTLNE